MESHRDQKMRMKASDATSQQPLSPWAAYQNRKKRSPQDSQLVSFGERITYTCAVGNEVASIHYDQGRGEIFFKGHNIGNTALDQWQRDLLYQFEKVLQTSEYADKFSEGYAQALEKNLKSPKDPYP